MAAKLALALFHLCDGYLGAFPYASHPVVLLASALTDVMLNSWAELRAREQAALDVHHAREEEAEEEDATAKPIARAFELLTELEQRLRRLETAGELEPVT